MMGAVPDDVSRRWRWLRFSMLFQGAGEDSSPDEGYGSWVFQFMMRSRAPGPSVGSPMVMLGRYLSDW
jgi:hypothetical protein